MTDLISRQTAVDALGDAHFKNYGNAILVIKDLPSAYPKKGKLIKHGAEEGYLNPVYTCSECGEYLGRCISINFCSNCGANMRGEE